MNKLGDITPSNRILITFHFDSVLKWNYANAIYIVDIDNSIIVNLNFFVTLNLEKVI